VAGTDTDETAAVLTDSTTPAVSASGRGLVTLSGGAATIDLTSFTCLDGRVVSFSGLKIRTIKIKHNSANTHLVTVTKGASSGFTGFGAAYSEVIPIGGETVKYDGGNGTAVSGSVKTLDLAGTLAESFYVSITGGA